MAIMSFVSLGLIRDGLVNEKENLNQKRDFEEVGERKDNIFIEGNFANEVPNGILALGESSHGLVCSIVTILRVSSICLNESTFNGLAEGEGV